MRNIIPIALIVVFATFILTPTVVALPPFSGVRIYAHSIESGSIGVESALFGKNIPVTINLSQQNEPHIAINPQNVSIIAAVLTTGVWVMRGLATSSLMAEVSIEYGGNFNGVIVF